MKKQPISFLSDLQAYMPQEVYYNNLYKHPQPLHTHLAGSGFQSGSKGVSHLFDIFYVTEQGLRLANTIEEHRPCLLTINRIKPLHQPAGRYAVSSCPPEGTEALLDYRSFQQTSTDCITEDLLWIFQKGQTDYFLKPYGSQAQYLNLTTDGCAISDSPQELAVLYNGNYFCIYRLVAGKRYYLRFTNTGGYQGYIEMNYINEGECLCTVGNNNFSLKKNQLLFIDGKNPHCLSSAAKLPCSAWSMSLELCPKQRGQIAAKELALAYPQLMQFFTDLNASGFKILSNDKTCFRLIKEMQKEQAQGKNPAVLNLLSNKLLIDIARLTALPATPVEEYCNKAIQFILGHYYSIQQIEEIAAAIGLNKIYLERIFKKYTGVTLGEYLNKIRMEKAEAILRDTLIPIGEIDTLIGINSRQSFYGQFKKFYGISPQKYRQLLQTKE